MSLPWTLEPRVNFSVNERASPAYLSSVVLHGLVIAIILVLAFVSSQSTPDTAKVMELVAGPGDNYMGTEATKLGSETGIALNVPKTPVAITPAPEPAPAEVAPAVPAEPMPVAKPAKPVTKLPANPMLKSVTKAEIRAESKIKMHDLKVKKDQEKAAAAAKKAETYAEFMKNQGASAVAPKGRTGGVAAGTTMADGAGGHALTAEQVDAMAAWKALLRQRWMDGFVPPADFDQKMTAQVTFRVAANGSISDIHVTGSTGGPAFETAVADALRHVTMPAVPTKRGADFSVEFSLRDQG